jgi:hypothetical protein
MKVKRLSAGPPSGERLVPLLTFEARRSIVRSSSPTRPGIVLASCLSLACDELRRREWSGGAGAGFQAGATWRRITPNLSLRHSRVRQLIAQFVDGFLSKVVFKEFGLRLRPKPS